MEIFILLHSFRCKKIAGPEISGPAIFRFLIGAGDRNRTGTDIAIRRILSPLRLPVPPPRHDKL